MLNDDDLNRYARQVIIPNFDEEGQEKLLRTNCLIIGAGGLGCPVALYASAAGFGQTGPLKELPAYDMVVQGMGGLMSVTGHPNSEPTRVGTSIGDITAGLFTAIGINAALYDRQKTGKGMYIDVSMLD